MEPLESLTVDKVDCETGWVTLSNGCRFLNPGKDRVEYQLVEEETMSEEIDLATLPHGVPLLCHTWLKFNPEEDEVAAPGGSVPGAAAAAARGGSGGASGGLKTMAESRFDQEVYPVPTTRWRKISSDPRNQGHFHQLAEDFPAEAHLFQKDAAQWYTVRELKRWLNTPAGKMPGQEGSPRSGDGGASIHAEDNVVTNAVNLKCVTLPDGARTGLMDLQSFHLLSNV